MARPAYDKNAANREIANRRTYPGQWDQHHADPRTSYYLFLRRIYGFDASAAWERVRRNFNPA